MQNDVLQIKTDADTIAYRDGIAIEKGVILAEDRIEKNYGLFKKWSEFFLMYPDRLLHMIKTKEAPDLFFYQALFLRTDIRFKNHCCVLTRASSKSFLAVLSKYLRCIFLPGSRCFICADVKGQAINVVQQKLEIIWNWYPMLKNEIFPLRQGSNMSQDYIELNFKNGSVFNIVSMSNSGRGERSNAGGVEEAALIKGSALEEVIIPMMNIDRRNAAGKINQNEPHGAKSFITTAGPKSCYMYSRLIDMIVDEVIDPKSTFVWGADWRLPVLHNLISKKTMDEQRTNSTEEGFARESSSIWTGASEDSWFNSNKLQRHRKILYYETSFQPYTIERGGFYIIGVDIARYNEANTAIVVIKVIPRSDYYLKKVVYLKVLNNMPFSDQICEIKKIILAFNPKEVVIDCNGPGIGIADLMITGNTDRKGQQYPAMYFINDNARPCPNGKEAFIYNMTASYDINSDIHSICYSEINSGHVDFLANERIVREKLMTTKRGQQMSFEKRIAFLIPYEMTSRLMDEFLNLKLKTTGNNNKIQIEQISRRIPKDRFSALEYALYRIKYYEDKEYRKSNKLKGIENFVFFTPRNKR